MKKFFLIFLICVFCCGCTTGKKRINKKVSKNDAIIESIMQQPVSDEKELEISSHIKDCTPFVQVNNGETNKYGTLSTKKLILGYENNVCIYKMFVNGKLDTECRFPKNILKKLSDTSTKRVYLKNWTEESMKYCQYYGQPELESTKTKSDKL